MPQEPEFQLTLEQKEREQKMLSEFSALLESERSRYESQAIQLLELKKFETELGHFKLSYFVEENTYLCRLQNLDKMAESYEIEFPIPESQVDKLETLVELFAQCEAVRIN